MTILSYSAQFSGEELSANDVAYRWESSIAGALQYAILLGIVVLLTLGLDRREFLALRRPSSWPRAAGISALVIVGVLIVSAVAAQFGNAEEEQGLIPDRFDSSRAAQFAAYAAVVVAVAPIVEVEVDRLSRRKRLLDLRLVRLKQSPFRQHFHANAIKNDWQEMWNSSSDFRQEAD